MATREARALDLFVIGGGINGAGIAADAAGRGLTVSLCEQGDLAGATSSASSKLIHGGLRYLEHGEFRLVRAALREREILLAKAPHLIRPLRFLLPLRAHRRPAWMLRAGLFLYDHLGRRRCLAPARRVSLAPSLGLRPELDRAYEYSDCWVDDARLVVLNALQAREHGAEILVRTRCIGARRDDDGWCLTLEEAETGRRFARRARALINAAGPWADTVLQRIAPDASRHPLRLVQGSHLIVPRRNADERAFILQHGDGRVVFVLPFEENFSLIGTTDRRYAGDPARVEATGEEIDYLLSVVNDHFRQPLRRGDVIGTFAGVRALCDRASDEPSAMTRDYTLALDKAGAPLLSVLGGKITTYRRLAEAALDALAPHLPAMGGSWTAEAPLPGGEIDTPARFAERLRVTYPFLAPGQALRLARGYGTRCLRFLEGRTSREALGEDFGAGLTAAEVDYLMTQEWAREPEDVLWRRTKLGLRLDADQVTRLAAYLQRHRDRPCPPASGTGGPGSAGNAAAGQHGGIQQPF